MIEIEEITKYRTSDGTEFEEEEKALAYEIELATKDIQPNDLIIKDKFGKDIEPKGLFWKVGSVFYVEVHSEAALEFFNEASRAEGTLPLEQGLGVYRYDEYSDLWVTPQDDVRKLEEQWETYNDKINFTYHL